MTINYKNLSQPDNRPFIKVNYTNGASAMKLPELITVHIRYDKDKSTITATSDNVRGLVAESDNFTTLVKKVEYLIIELSELNNIDEFKESGYKITYIVD